MFRILSRLKLKTSVNFAKHYQPTKCFHLTGTNFAKLFVDKENQHAHSILKRSAQYNLWPATEDIFFSSETEFNPNENWGAKSNGDLLDGLKLVLATVSKKDGPQISDAIFDTFVDAFTSKCSTFTDDEILDALKFLNFIPETPSVITKNFVELWQSLDDVCNHRCRQWDTNRILLVCDCWYALNLSKTGEFVWTATKLLGRKINQLDQHQLVQLMFYCNLIRKPIINMFAFEENLVKFIDTLSLDELSVMSMGFFKTRTPIRNLRLLEQIARRTMLEFDTITDISLVNILKVFRYSCKLEQAPLITEFLDKITPHIEKFSLLACLHIALTGTDIQMCHPASLEKITRRILSELKSARIKDMERIAFVLTLHDFKTEDGVELQLLDAILKDIPNRTMEIFQYPRCLPNLLHFLTMKGLSEPHLIDFVLNQGFIKHAFGGNMQLGREIFCLDSFAQINLKNVYQGRLVSDEQRRTMGKILVHYIPEKNGKFKLSATDRLLLDLQDTFENTNGKTTHMMHVLPHYDRPDIIAAWNRKSNSFVDFAFNQNHYSGKIWFRDEVSSNVGQDVELLAIVVGGWNNFVRNENRPTGLLKLKIDQLKLCGYKVTMIPWFEWQSQVTASQKAAYLKHHCNVAVNELF